MCVYVRTKFQVSSIILASFRHGEVILRISFQLVISRISRDILCQSTLDVFAPYMQKKIRYNNKEFLDIQATRECRLTLKRVGNMIIIYSHNNNPFMKKKTLKKKKIMTRSKLCNKSNKSRTSVHWLN